MTVSSTTARASYTGNGTTTVFAVPFYFLAAADLRVILRSGTTEVVQTLTTNYTVTGAGVASGGSVTMLVAPAAGTTLTILRNTPATQGTDLLPNDRLPAESLEGALDKLTMLVQQVDEVADRALQFPASDSPISPQLPVAASRAGKVLSFDSSGNPVANIGISNNTLIGEETQTATAGQTVFNLTAAAYAPGSRNLSVFIDGVNQIVGSSYTETSSSVVTFSEGLRVGARVKFVSLKA